MIVHENRLPADGSHEISCIIWLFLKKRQNLKFRFMGLGHLHSCDAGPLVKLAMRISFLLSTIGGL